LRAKLLAPDFSLALVEHLEEIQARRLHNELGFSSLWEFSTQYLGLSEGAAQRRISAMRLARDVPEAKAALQSGKLSLSNAAKVQSFRQAQKKQGMALSDPRELIQKVENLAQPECEARLLEISPQVRPAEGERVVSAAQDREIRLVISSELHAKLQWIKGLIAHSKPNASYAELLEYLVKEALPRLEKQKGIVQNCQGGHTDQKTQATAAAAADVPQGSELASEIAEKARALPKGKRVYLPVALKRAVYARSGGRCEYIAHGKRCGSGYMLEIDHKVPLSAGGGHDLSQLRHLCRAHNLQQFEAWVRREVEASVSLPRK
jgi:hypothetical protein